MYRFIFRGISHSTVCIFVGHISDKRAENWLLKSAFLLYNEYMDDAIHDLVASIHADIAQLDSISRGVAKEVALSALEAQVPPSQITATDELPLQSISHSFSSYNSGQSIRGVFSVCRASTRRPRISPPDHVPIHR